MPYARHTQQQDPETGKRPGLTAFWAARLAHAGVGKWATTRRPKPPWLRRFDGSLHPMPCARHTQQQDPETGKRPGLTAFWAARLAHAGVGKWATTRRPKPPWLRRFDGSLHPMPCARHTQQQDPETGKRPGLTAFWAARLAHAGVGKWATTRRPKPPWLRRFDGSLHPMPCARHTQQQDPETGFAPGAHCRPDGRSRLVGGYASRRARDPRGLADSMARCTRCRAHGTLSSKTPKRPRAQYRGRPIRWLRCCWTVGVG
ncbi:hypothetical protein SAMN02799638_02741 [Arthrobacter sp. UNCCL28]|nr:hypothetical protein SAMN02799638_02741 [Arthrobacter sp. UNCCL28]